MSSVVSAEEMPVKFETWIDDFSDWQKRIGFDTGWLGDYKFEIKFDWDNAGDSIEFGDFEGFPKWNRSMQVPQQGIRDAIIQMIAVQGDTEFASVEQQNHLLETAPTEYDRKSALRIMCEEQRHGWQMAYILVKYFGEQGAREASKLLERNAQDGSRLLESFNHPIPHWVDFFCFTQFIDRDGKFQLNMLSTSSFKPLAASMGPMLKEEAFHLGTGANGLRRIVRKGAIPCELLQRYINKWASTGMDLFGVDESTSAEWAYVYGIKGRYDERKNKDLADRNKLNEESRMLYYNEICKDMERISRDRMEGQHDIKIPNPKFNRGIGDYANKKYTVEGDEWNEDTMGSYEEYLNNVLPNEESERMLDEYFKEEWIQYREWRD